MIFDEMRRQNADWYTEHPLLSMSEEELKKLAKQAGFDDLDAFKIFCFQPSPEMTCPLCGRPQNHLSDCKGCGTGAFMNWDFEEAYGENAWKTLRNRLKEVLIPKYGEEKAGYVVKHAYDCCVCADCWKETIQSSEAFRTCPLRLLADRTLTGNLAETFWMSGNLWAIDKDDIAGSVKQWGINLWNRWVASAAEDVADWRATILEAALQIST